MNLVKRNSVWPKKYDPFFDNFWNWPSKELSNFDGLVPKVQISETNTEHIVEVELPGITEDNLNVTINNGYLTIEAKKEEHKEEKEDGKIYYSEISSGSYSRTVRLSNDVEQDVDKLTAKYKNGVLKVSLPKIINEKIEEPEKNTSVKVCFE